jgi:hypothetical protein
LLARPMRNRIVWWVLPMRRIFGQSLDAALQRLDQESCLRIRIFAFKLLVVVTVALALAAPRGYPVFAMVWVFCLWQGFFAALAAVFRHHKLGALSLTAWDESAAFIAIALLARFANAVTL